MFSARNQSNLPEVVQKVLQGEMEPLFGNKDAKTLNIEFLAKNSNSLPHIVSGLYGTLVIQ